MKLKELEERLKKLEDIEEIKKLQRIYGYYLEHWEGPQIIELFSDNSHISIDIGKGIYKGQEGIKQFFLTDKLPPEFLHVVMQISGIVDIDSDGKTAKGRWYGFGPLSIPEKEIVRAIWSLGVYENEYVKEDGKWRFKKILYSTIFCTPYEDGWVKTPITPVQFRRFDGPKPEPSPNNKLYPSGYVLPYHYKNPVTEK